MSRQANYQPVGSSDGPSKTLQCPQCGRPVDSLHCDHCGDQLPGWQGELYVAVARKLAELGGNRADATNKGGISKDGPSADDLPKDSGDTTTPQRPFDGLAGVPDGSRASLLNRTSTKR